MADLTDIGLTDKQSLLIQLRREDFGLSEDKVRYGCLTFDPKTETHITVLGKSIGQDLARRSDDPAFKECLACAVKAAAWQREGWSYEKDRFYHVAKDKEETGPEGGTEQVHAESIIQTVRAPGIAEFYIELSKLLGQRLEVPPLHVTLYTLGDPEGIGLPNQEAFEAYVTRGILPEELVRVLVR